MSSLAHQKRKKKGHSRHKATDFGSDNMIPRLRAPARPRASLTLDAPWRAPTRRADQILTVRNLSTKIYRRQGGSASRRVNDKMTDYRNFMARTDITTIANRKQAYDKLSELESMLESVSSSKQARVREIKAALNQERKLLNLANKNEIMQNYPIKTPKIVFRYDSRPIALALSQGYVAQDPENGTITENGENQSMVGGAHNFVGSLNYRGYAKINAHSLTKKSGGKTIAVPITAIQSIFISGAKLT